MLIFGYPVKVAHWEWYTKKCHVRDKYKKGLLYFIRKYSGRIVFIWKLSIRASTLFSMKKTVKSSFKTESAEQGASEGV